MEAKFYDNIDEFYDIAYPFLLEHEAENNLPLAILISLKKNKDLYGEEEPLLFSLTNNDKLELIALRTPLHDLLIAYTDNLEAINVLVDELFKRKEKLPGVLSFKEAADTFAQLWSEKNSKKCNLYRRERVYQLERVSEDCLGNRVFSMASKTHQALVLKWAGKMMKEAIINATDDDIQRTKKIYAEEFEQNKSSFYILFDSNKPVSIARKAGKTPNGNFVNLVYTPPSLRRRGYATECVAKLSKLLLMEGNKYCFLFTDLSNPTSNSIYQKIGYRPVIDENHYKFLEN
ncbi:MAG: GNAT family N-acetyltransferase [Candidatus Lokiarchaeota archaeon]|nr:GNAT family N-acetyltransferase [Candidatus Lokiarchaeota archaeon]